MSSDHQTSVHALNSKFEDQFTDINKILDNVITKNGKNPTIVINQQISDASTQPDELKKSGSDFDYLPHAKAMGHTLFDKNNLLDLVRQSGSKESELNTTSNSYRHSQAETLQATPIKARNVPSSGSTAEAYRYGTPSQDDEAYDYAGGVFSSPQVEVSRQERRAREAEPLQEIPFDINKAEEVTKTAAETAPKEVAHAPDVEKYVLPVVKRDINTTKLVDETLKHLNRDMHFSHKYAPEEVLRSIEKTQDGKFYLVDSLKPDQKVLKESVKNHPHYKEDPIDQIVVLASPEREIGTDEKVLSVYQQVSEVYNDDTSYIGEKFLGLRQGQGTYHFQEGYRYEGTWEDDQMSGFGILWVDDIKWYEGEWKDNAFHGKGIVYNLTPEAPEAGKVYMNDFNQVGNAWEKYEGKFSKGSKHGFGTITLTNGDTFTGKFEEDNIHGRGSYATADRKKITPGMWENNVLKRVF